MQKQTQISTNQRQANEINKINAEIEELKKKMRHLKKEKLQLLKNLAKPIFWSIIKIKIYRRK